MAKKYRKDVDFWGGVKIIIVVLIAVAIPTVPITYLLTKFAELNVCLSVFIGLVVTFSIIKALGWDRPAYENQNKCEDDEDND